MSFVCQRFVERTSNSRRGTLEAYHEAEGRPEDSAAALGVEGFLAPDLEHAIETCGVGMPRALGLHASNGADDDLENEVSAPLCTQFWTGRATHFVIAQHPDCADDVIPQSSVGGLKGCGNRTQRLPHVRANFLGRFNGGFIAGSGWLVEVRHIGSREEVGGPD